MNALSERLIQGCLPLASIECFSIVKPLIAETFTARDCAMYCCTSASLAASEGRSFREMVFCILSGFYPEMSSIIYKITKLQSSKFYGKFNVLKSI